MAKESSQLSKRQDAILLRIEEKKAASAGQIVEYIQRFAGFGLVG